MTSLTHCSSPIYLAIASKHEIINLLSPFYSSIENKHKILELVQVAYLHHACLAGVRRLAWSHDADTASKSGNDILCHRRCAL